MHGYSRLGGARSGSSPPSSPRFRHGRSKSNGWANGFVGGGISGSKERTLEKLLFGLMSAVFRRRGLLLFAPLLYISGMLLYMGSLNFDAVSIKNGVVFVHNRAPPGSVYRSPQVFEKLWPLMESESNNGSVNALFRAWNMREGWKPCADKSVIKTELPVSNGFFIVEANGGLNQQRLSISDAVAVAGLLNATLLIPIFHFNSVWRDSSKFGDIFDEDFFISALQNHVHVVRQLPEDILGRFDNNISNIVNLRVKAWTSPAHYIQKVLPQLRGMGAVRIAPFSNRLAQNVPSKIQGLRCFANFEALRFSEPIRTLAESMVDRMVKYSSQSEGKYVSVHLRFEEVGMMLRGMGFDNTTTVYVAAGKIYKEQKFMAPLKQMFPLLQTKDTLATPEELASFMGHSSRLAALDYTVCLHSEVFVTTQGGNFPHFLMGHRRYLFGGHAKTIKPDKRKLALLLDNSNIRYSFVSLS
ncbi:O-fucosyltransferase 9-like isoform X2 [Prosopis cineraria]|uniref:O-fucosyltransferase 9-like isoform X2 n=1 Tax=Prosopis cineraria TaxID=364024 RepID=UPI002410A52C|nr:O-fucosyltransferase 9-like isoform X2 [Prosopis cineraria]